MMSSKRQTPQSRKDSLKTVLKAISMNELNRSIDLKGSKTPTSTHGQLWATAPFNAKLVRKSSSRPKSANKENQKKSVDKELAHTKTELKHALRRISCLESSMEDLKHEVRLLKEQGLPSAEVASCNAGVFKGGHTSRRSAKLSQCMDDFRARMQDFIGRH